MTTALLWFPNDDAKMRIYTSLRDWILYTKLKPGQRIRERELADEFGVSRTPMREVMQLLCHQGLLVIKPRYGVFVAPIEDDKVRQVYETRAPLETAVARLAAERASDEDVENLLRLSEKLARHIAAGEYEQVVITDSLFHDTLAKAAGNMILRQTREFLHNICLRYWFLTLDTYKPGPDEAEEHRRVALAVSRRQPDKAASIQSRHVERFIERLDEN